MIDMVHFSEGGISVMSEAVTIVPAITLTGEAMESMILSSQGM
jgi:hypothetical protein